MRILDACLASRHSVAYLEIHNYFYNFNTAFDTIEFLGYLQEFTCLKELKMDYFIFCGRRIIDVIAENGRTHLRNLEIFFDETDMHSHIVPDKKWRKLKKCCPNLKVSITISWFYIWSFLSSVKNITFSGNACHYEQIQFIFLMKNIPLSSFSMYTGNKYNQRVSRNFEETIRHLIKNYYRTLGNPMRTFQLPIFKLFWYF